MSNRKRPTNRPSARGEAARRAQGRGTNRTIWFIVAGVVVVGVALLVAVLAGDKKAPPSRFASKELVSRVEDVPEATFVKVGTGSATTLPAPIDAPELTAQGKPRVLFIGAEYCPYCAAQRWPIAIALARFGSFEGLTVTHSSTNDVFPDTKTLSFHGATYTSDLLSFEAVETQGNTLENGVYPTLDTPTAEQQKLFATYNSPPYVKSQGSIPFLLMGGKYVMSGASYDPGILEGLSAEEIAADLDDPSSEVAKSTLGSANVITAALCDLTGGKPATVCSSKTITDIQAKIAEGP